MGCCGKPPESTDKEPKSLKNRSCTDVLCLLFFLVFLGALATIFFIGLATGDYNEYLYEADYTGQRCGVGKMAGKSKAFYPRIPRDMLDQNEIVQKGDFWKLRLYALCVKECPKEFDIDNPTKSLIKDYAWDKTSPVTQALGSGTQQEWLSPTPTVDIINRCIPRSTSTQEESSMCAYPKCTSPEAVALGVVCANQPGFMSGEWPICGFEAGSGEVTGAECAAQKDICKVRATETTTKTFALYADDEASRAMMASIAKQVGGVFEIVSAVASAWVLIVIGGIALPIALAFTYMLLLFLFAKTIIYGLLILLIICELAATFICFSKSGIQFQGVSAQSLLDKAQSATNISVPDATSSALATVAEESKWMYSLGFLILGLLSVITIFTVITSRKKIRIVAAIVKEATTVFTAMPALMLFPSFSTAMQIVASGWFLVTMFLVHTTKSQSIDLVLNKAPNITELAQLGVVASASDTANIALPSVDPVGSIRSFLENEQAINILTVVVLYGFFVVTQFIGGAAWCTMSGATYGWYFFKDNKEEQIRLPITKSLGRSLFYHTGSIAFSAFVIAFCDMLRAAAAYLEKQMGPTNNFVVKLAFKVLNCCLACLKKTVKFISYYGLVWVACQGSSFCGGCFKTFFFFLQNPGQVAINALVTKLLKLVAILSSPLACAVVFYYILDTVLATKHAGYPAAIIFFLSALMTVSCMTVFECTITTIFVCCFQDKAEFGGRFMSKRLASAFGIKQKETASDGKAEGGGDDEPVQSL